MWLVRQIKIEESVLHILSVRLSELEVLAEWSELWQKAQKVEKVAQRQRMRVCRWRAIVGATTVCERPLLVRSCSQIRLVSIFSSCLDCKGT